MLREMANGGSTYLEFNEIFNFIDPLTGRKGSDVLRDVIQVSNSTPNQIQWGDKISTGKYKSGLIGPWSTAFYKLVRSPNYIKIEDRSAEKYFNNAENIFNWIDNNLGIRTIRSYALSFDISVQCGSLSPSAKDIVLRTSRGERTVLTNPEDYSNNGDYPRGLSSNQRFIINDMKTLISNLNNSQRDIKILFYIAAANAIDENNLDRFTKDVWFRKSTIANGTGYVHGAYRDLSSIGLNDYIIR
jgi:hypothetical protein